MELELPLGDGPTGELAGRRLDHLAQVVGEEPGIVARLAAAFGSLGAIYAASEAELAEVVGPITAARTRWFLDAPVAGSRYRRSGRGLRRAA
jgi:hypothetical protein